MTKELLDKYLNNRCNDSDIKEVLRWINMHSYEDESRNWGWLDWILYQEEVEASDQEKYDAMLDKIHHKINIQDCRPGMSPAETPSSFSITIRFLTRAAAILLIPVLGILFFTLSRGGPDTAVFNMPYYDTLEIVAPIGSRAIAHLSDGSEVFLNSGSKIKYPHSFTGENREVNLTGEGYFNVAQNAEKPFVVKTGKMNIKALGTSFNVLAYPDDRVVQTTLVEGIVELEEFLDDGTKRTIGAIEPGQHVQYHTITRELTSCNGDIAKYIAWKDGKLIFNNDPISEVAVRLSRMYDVDIEVSEDIREYTYTVTFEDETLFHILDLMAIATPIAYKIVPRARLDNGSFEKQKIILKKIQ
jgi:transmembrane sensor